MIEELDEKEEGEARRYLLGEMQEAEMTQFEERLMTDDQLFETLRIVEEELLDAHAAGRLTAEDQERANNYFLAAPQRRERLDFAKALQTHADGHMAPGLGAAEDPSGGVAPATTKDTPLVAERGLVESPGQKLRSQFWSSWQGYAGLAAAAAILLAFIVGIWPIVFPKPDLMQVLNKAYQVERPTEAAITGFFYAPAPPKTRGGEKDKFDYVSRDHAEALLREELATRVDAGSYHDAGRLYLAKRDYDGAREQFEKALALKSNDAQLESDLGAAYLEKGKAAGPGEGQNYYDQSLIHLTRAIELDDALLPARFNLALLYERMGQKQEAQAAWRKYLEKDGTSKWAGEARDYLSSSDK